MIVCLDGVLLPLEKLRLSYTNRAFTYGDGLFETIIRRSGRLCFLPDHLQRLERGMQVLGLSFEEPLLPQVLEDMVETLAQRNGLQGDLRIKLQVYRQEGGLYTPATEKAHYLLSVQSHRPWEGEGIRVALSQQRLLLPGPFSFFKSLSSMPYVLAGLEKQRLGVDDLLLCNAHGEIAELISSNLLWLEGDTFYTPPVASGCKQGIACGNLPKVLQAYGMSLVEKIPDMQHLSRVEYVFSVNVANIIPFSELEGRKMCPMRAWLRLLQQVYELP